MSDVSRSLQTSVSTIQSVVPTVYVFEFTNKCRCMSRYHTVRQQHCKLPRQQTVAKQGRTVKPRGAVTTAAEFLGVSALLLRDIDIQQHFCLLLC